MPNRLSFALTVAVAVALAACGGGGGGSSSSGGPSGPGNPPPPHVGQPGLPWETGSDARRLASNEPTSTGSSSNRQYVFIGSPDISRVSGNLVRSLDGSHDGVEVGHVRVRDGISGEELLRYLRADAAHYDGNQVRRWGNTPPTVRMIEGATEEDRTDTLHAVRLINSVLPPNWQLKFDDREAAPDGRVNPGYIEVNFIPRERWSGEDHGRAVGVAHTTFTGGRITGAAVLVDPTRRRTKADRMDTLLHELLHALGRGHVSPSDFPSTIMHPSGDLGRSDWLILSPLDEAAMYAVYSRLRSGTPGGDLDMNDLGPWSNVSTYVAGRLDYVPGRRQSVVFGAVWQNGLVRPYAAGLDPSAPLQRQLSGSASWSGRLLGLTPRAESVAGAMDMTVQLASLDGELEFTELEKWSPHVEPGAVGTGVQWGDGDLHYSLALQEGRVFVETGGDEGQITGTFFGDNQRRVGGTLRRRDLAAGFAGTRQ